MSLKKGLKAIRDSQKVRAENRKVSIPTATYEKLADGEITVK